MRMAASPSTIANTAPTARTQSFRRVRRGSAVDGRDQQVTDRIRRSKSDKQPRLARRDSTNREDGADEKQRALDTERGVHQPGQRRTRQTVSRDR